MKVYHIESGLGNQMLDYCELLASRYMNPDHEFYIETILYDIPDAGKVYSMWNGFELEKVFGIREKNIKSLFSMDRWEEVMKAVKESKFWEDNWRYSNAICDAFAKCGVYLKNLNSRPHQEDVKHYWKEDFAKTRLGYFIKRKSYKALEEIIVKPKRLFICNDDNEYSGHTLGFMYKKSGIEMIDSIIRKAFTFPEFVDEYNMKMDKMIKTSNSVAIHARRGDMLGINAPYYQYGYFKRAIRFIKRNTSNPSFYFFCDEKSMEWVKQNIGLFGLDNSQDDIYFITGNDGEHSYRDMQLISHCRHAVITNSSFGFWGAYLNNYKNKITCSPDVRINTTHSF